MSLLRKLSWIFFLTLLVVLYGFIHYHLKNQVILQSFRDLELAEANKNMARCIDAFNREVHHLNKLASDWAVWDDTYRFAKDRNQEFIDSNLQMDTLEYNSSINLVYILDPHGKVVWGESRDTAKGGKISIGNFSGKSLEKICQLIDLEQIESEKTGILLTDQGPMLLSIRPILTSRTQGPAAGTFIMGRFLTSKTLISLMDQTRVDFKIKVINDRNLPHNEMVLVEKLSNSPCEVSAENDKFMNAYGMLQDIYDRPAILIHASLIREIMDKGRTAARYVSVSFMITAILGIFFVLFVLKMKTIDERRRTASVEALVKQRTLELIDANKETEKARIAAVEASKAKSEFLANMSHEIRTPLNGVIGMTEIAMPTIQNEKQREIFETISREAHFLLGIINNILDFSKIEARKVEIENLPFDLHLLMADMGKSIMFLAERKGLTCIVDLAPDVPRYVKGDPGRIRQILMNLAGNALKFTKDGGLFIYCALVEDMDDSCVIKFSVSDTGIGIEKDKQDKIFDSFTQVDGSTTRKYGGTGLGITISKQLAELMGGDLSVQSEIGKGSTFSFTVVLAKHKNMVTRSVSQQINHIQVLVVGGGENEPLPFIKHLDGLGCKTEAAISGKEALTRLKQEAAAEDFNLILIDYLLSDTDGFTLAADIKAMENLVHMPIILTTSVGNIGDGRRCEDIGINGYLSDPLDPVLLKKAIRLVMGVAPRSSASEKTCLVTRHYIAETIKDEGRILLVEDYPTNRQVAVNFITMAGFEVDVAENGKEAVDKFLECSYALIFMDIQMPVMDGYEATRAIRQLESEGKGGKEGDHTPIVAMTANALTRDRENSLEAGMDDFITKPVSRASLLTVISNWLPGYSDSSLLSTPAESSKEKQSSPQDPEIPLNYDQALSEFMGDKDVLVSTLHYFLNHCREQVGIIASALSENNSGVVRAEAHKIKGGSANLTMQPLSSAAAELELAGMSGNLDGADVHVSKISLELDRLDLFLSQI